MDCKKCGTPLPDGGIFCPSCGARCDGKKACKNCSSLIDETAIYCTYCGARVDGKTACANCGTVFEGSFCPSCGVKSNRDSKSGSQKVQKAASGLTKFAAVERILSPCLALTAILVLFVLSFFIGVTVELFGANANQYAKELGAIDTTIFYYFGDSFKETDAALAAFSTNLNVTSTARVLNALDATMLVCGIAHLVIMVFILVYASIKVGIKLYRGERVEVGGMLGGAIGSFLAMSAIMLASGRVKVSANSITVTSVGVNGASVAGIIVSLIVAVAVAVLSFLAKGRPAFKLKSVLDKSLSLVAVAFGVVAILLLGREIVNVVQNELNVSVGISAFGFSNVIALEMLDVKTPSQYVDSLNYAIVETFLTIAVAVLLGVVIWLLVKSLLGDGGKLASVITSAIGALLSVVWLVFALLFKNEYFAVEFLGNEENALNAATKISLSGSVIVTLVFALLVLGLAIAAYVLRPKEE